MIKSKINFFQDTSVKNNVFLIGAKSLGSYGGYETFIDMLTYKHKNNKEIKYYIACKANGEGAKRPKNITSISNNSYLYNNALCFEISVPSFIGKAQAIYYDCLSLNKCIHIIKDNKITNAIVYIMACRIGLFYNFFVKRLKKLGATLIVNPDGHEWKRTKWNKIIRKYWKYSERKMIEKSDYIVCDSLNIEKYINNEYKKDNTFYISYGADLNKSLCLDNEYIEWIRNKNINREYYLLVGRFVPENNYETIIKEFMKTKIAKDLVIITNENERFYKYLIKKLKFDTDSRIKFVGTVYNKELLKKIREEAYGYIHGHEVGGTNPSLLEALACTKLNLLYDVCFNREVAENAAIYWKKDEGNLLNVFEKCERVDVNNYEKLAKERIKNNYTWEHIANKYSDLWKMINK